MASNPPGGGIMGSGITWSDVGHGALDIAGLVPGFGEAADLANAAWLATEGDYLGAGLSIISMVPIVGDVIGKGGKLLKAGGKLAGPALEALRKMDFDKMLAPLATHPKIGPHIKKITAALDKWRNDVVLRSRGIQPCPQATKALGESAAMIGKTPVPARILAKLSPEQLKVFNDAIARIEDMPIPGKDLAVFYSGKVGNVPAWKLAEAGGLQTVNKLSKDILNAGNIRDLLPDDAMSFVDKLASKRLADTASGVINFVGDLDKISPTSVFRTTELPALLKNAAVDPASRAKLLEMKKVLDSKYGG